MTPVTATFTFALDAALEAAGPPEEAGGRRSDIKMLVTDRTANTNRRHIFDDLPALLRRGDLLVVNDSATMPAAVELDRLIIHFSTPDSDGQWLVELRQRVGDTHAPYSGGAPGEWLPLPAGATLKLVERRTARLWSAELNQPVAQYLSDHGRPIRYSYVTSNWPLSKYQTVFAREPGSAEMPSAGRPFTQETMAALRSAGIDVAAITLHTGVASAEVDEPPYPERYRVDGATAEAVMAAKAAGRRVIAVGTTVVRALETAADSAGVVHAASGLTEHVVTPTEGVRAVDGILTGLHEPRSSHLAMLAALCPTGLLADAYREAITHRFLWHEFGDVHLIY